MSDLLQVDDRRVGVQLFEHMVGPLVLHHLRDRPTVVGRIAEDDEISQIWGDVWLSYSEELPLPKDELQREYELVIDPNGIDDEETYLSTVRSGRPRLTRQQRRADEDQNGYDA